MPGKRIVRISKKSVSGPVGPCKAKGKKSPWIQHVCQTYREMKAKDRSVTYSEAMQAAAKCWTKSHRPSKSAACPDHRM